MKTWLLSAAVAAVLFGLLGSGAAQTGPTVPVVMLADLHFDPFHDPGKISRLAAAPIGQWDAILREPASPHQAEEFAATQAACKIRGEDAQYELVDSALAAAKAASPSARFVTVSGDYLVHKFECKYDNTIARSGGASETSLRAGSSAFAIKSVAFIMKKVEDTFPGLPVYITMGNNDVSCGNFEVDEHDAMYAGTRAEVMKGLKGASPVEIREATRTFESGGYYTVMMRPPMRNTRLIVVNDLYFSLPKYHYNCQGKEDFSGKQEQVAWLTQELAKAKKRGERVWVMGHIPTGIDSYNVLAKPKEVCSGKEEVDQAMADDTLERILTVQPNLIKFALFAHSHADEFRLLHASGGDRAADVPMKLVTSISSIDGNMPSFTIARVNPVSATLVDYAVYMSSNKTGIDAKWTFVYDFGDTYHVPDFSVKSEETLIEKFRSDPTGPDSEAYRRFYYTGTRLPWLDREWPSYVCMLDHGSAESYKACACPAK
jgi:sphingomyelin phosphodiesterase acid-like 3